MREVVIVALAGFLIGIIVAAVLVSLSVVRLDTERRFPPPVLAA